MNVQPLKITVRELVAGYSDDGDGGVTGYSGRLDIRPPFQREFVYKEKQRDAVINSIRHGFPLNVMYWSMRDDGTFEVIDGQQRTISIAQYVDGDFSFEDMYFDNLPDDKQDEILNYPLQVYVCTGTTSEKLDWFEIINIAGERLYPQELRNAAYSGSWVTDAKRYFSRNGNPAYEIARDYLTGSPIRQDYLETAIKWISGGEIKEYMGKHKRDPSAVALWNYFQSVISWVKATFTVKRVKFMRGVDWGGLYNEHKDRVLDPVEIEERIADLIQTIPDHELNGKGIYPYILTGEERHLRKRSFSDTVKQKVYDRQGGICAISGEKMAIEDMEADHRTPFIKGGETTETNCQMVGRRHNRTKSSR